MGILLTDTRKLLVNQHHSFLLNKEAGQRYSVAWRAEYILLSLYPLPFCWCMYTQKCSVQIFVKGREKMLFFTNLSSTNILKGISSICREYRTSFCGIPHFFSFGGNFTSNLGLEKIPEKKFRKKSFGKKFQEINQNFRRNFFPKIFFKHNFEKNFFMNNS